MMSGTYTVCDSMPCIMRSAMLIFLSCSPCLCNSYTGGSRGLEDRALDL